MYQGLGVDFDRSRSQSEMSVNTALAKLARVYSYNTQVGLRGGQLVVIAKSLCT